MHDRGTDGCWAHSGPRQEGLVRLVRKAYVFITISRWDADGEGGGRKLRAKCSMLLLHKVNGASEFPVGQAEKRVGTQKTGHRTK